MANDEHALKTGDQVQRTDTGRQATVVNAESLFVALVQYVNDAKVDWVSRSLLAKVEPI